MTVVIGLSHSLTLCQFCQLIVSKRSAITPALCAEMAVANQAMTHLFGFVGFGAIGAFLLFHHDCHIACPFLGKSCAAGWFRLDALPVCSRVPMT